MKCAHCGRFMAWEGDSRCRLCDRDLPEDQLSLWPSRTLLLTSCEELELVEVDVLVAGAAAVGPAAQDGLQEQHRLRQR
jgi:hypothetical protein